MRRNPVFALIEPLEARIAPATIFVGGATDKYTDVPFYSTTGVADPFGANFVGGAHTYYVKLVEGDTVINGASDQLIKVQSGTVVAFFTDLNNNGGFDINELTGLSVGQNAKIVLKCSVNGDIVGNYNDATGRLEPTSLIGSTQSLGSLVVDNANSIIFGGSVKSVTGKQVNRILAGNAADGVSYDFNAGDTGGGATLGVDLASKQAGSDISGIVLTGTDVILAGDGGAGAKGGSLSSITLISDSDGFLMQAGNGGAGAGKSSSGGAGGSITKVYHQGTSDISPDSKGIDWAVYKNNPNDPDARVIARPAVQILAGKGGAGDQGGNGGAGGKLDSINVGYEIVSGKTKISTFLVADSVLLQAGAGGDGQIGGLGGSVSNLKLVTLAPSNPDRPEIGIGAGDGGGGIIVKGSKAGAGGSLTNLDVREINPTDFLSEISLHAGNGGISNPGGGTEGSSGGNGGSVSNCTLIGYNITVVAGYGTSGQGTYGITGGNGGSLNSIAVPVSTEGIIPRTLSFVAGKGGDAEWGNGAAGGSVSNVKVSPGAADLTKLEVTGGDGGEGAKGAGGAGGSVSSSNFYDGDFFNGAVFGLSSLNSGKGGNGSTSGGNGGDIANVTFVGDDLSFTVTSGSGGDGEAGNGGNGGKIRNNSSFNSQDVGYLDPLQPAPAYTGLIQSGNGGNGGGTDASGGAAGAMTQVTGAADLHMKILGGNGGEGGGKGTEGQGSSMSKIILAARYGDATLSAGNAGGVGEITGAKAGIGGSIKNASVIGSRDVIISAGDGALGGSGGSLATVGFTGADSTVEPTGHVAITAGAGSQGPSAAGSGGSIKILTGFVGDVGITTIVAGVGADSGDHLKAGTGGSISDLSLIGGGNAIGTELRIQAGNAGNASSLATGAKGGNVTGVSVTELGKNCVFRFIAAGDGGVGSGAGGAGGSIDNVTVSGSDTTNGDIGVRRGAVFGYDQMGGLIAGMGGSGIKAGLAGSVTNVVADAIASIVAGRMTNCQAITPANLVAKVAHIDLNGSAKPVAKADGSFNLSEWDSASMVGAIVHPDQAGANQFAVANFGFGSSTTFADGFIAAVSYPTGKLNTNNFIPQALLTVDPSDPAKSFFFPPQTSV